MRENLSMADEDARPAWACVSVGRAGHIIANIDQPVPRVLPQNYRTRPCLTKIMVASCRPNTGSVFELDWFCRKTAVAVRSVRPDTRARPWLVSFR